MQYELREFVRTGMLLTSFIISVVTVMALTIFASQPTNAILFTNSLLLVVILTQVLSVLILSEIKQNLEGGRKK